MLIKPFFCILILLVLEFWSSILNHPIHREYINLTRVSCQNCLLTSLIYYNNHRIWNFLFYKWQNTTGSVKNFKRVTLNLLLNMHYETIRKRHWNNALLQNENIFEWIKTKTSNERWLIIFHLNPFGQLYIKDANDWNVTGWILYTSSWVIVKIIELDK